MYKQVDVQSVSQVDVQSVSQVDVQAGVGQGEEKGMAMANGNNKRYNSGGLKALISIVSCLLITQLITIVSWLLLFLGCYWFLGFYFLGCLCFLGFCRLLVTIVFLVTT